MGFSITADHFIFSVENVKIKYMVESILQTYKELPFTFFGDSPFENVRYIDNTVQIRVDEWIPFYSKLYRLMFGDSDAVRIFSSRMRDNLLAFNTSVDSLSQKYANHKNVDCKELEKCFHYYSISQGYAFLNLILPSDTLNQLFKNDYRSEYTVDDFMISLVESHRIQQRKKELELSLKLRNNSLTKEDIDNYKCNEFLFTRESEWNFYTPALESDELILKALKTLNGTLTAEDIHMELNRINSSRNSQLQKIYQILDEEYAKKAQKNNRLYYLITFLLNVATEEEDRHIINTKFMYFIGKSAFNLDVDVARLTTTKLIAYLSVDLNLK
ncbi:hypothetical protein [Paenibacillus tengchongensis]|uniref:hypothetical protein n=1 Tax=Paenibacillus tengchongensis TaxID=2608684 RepID=UPI00124F07CF|nr:hypothetical protein [Paenibacillus tengchongensis]